MIPEDEVSKFAAFELLAGCTKGEEGNDCYACGAFVLREHFEIHAETCVKLRIRAREALEAAEDDDNYNELGEE